MFIKFIITLEYLLSLEEVNSNYTGFLNIKDNLFTVNQVTIFANSVFFVH